MQPDSRQKRIGQKILDLVETNDYISNNVLFSRLEREFPSMDGAEYAAALADLRDLDLLQSIDGGYDKLFTITRSGIRKLDN